MTRDEIVAKMNSFSWYHKIRLKEDIVTPGHDFDAIWNMIRRSREQIDYNGKNVLDLGAWDGMWSFEAEGLGAEHIVAADCALQPLSNMLFCREILGSKVLPYYNVSMYRLQEALDIFINGSHNAGEQDRRFDIVQHLGVLYHLRDPLLSLIETRSVMKRGGKLLLETAYSRNDATPMMVFNGPTQQEGRVYRDATTWWAPNMACLKEMLSASLFKVFDESVSFATGSHDSDNQISRICLVAEAVGKNEIDLPLWDELHRRFRNNGPFLRDI